MSILTQYQLHSPLSALYQHFQKLASITDLLVFYRSIQECHLLLLTLERYVRTQSNRFGTKLPHVLLIHAFTFLERTSYHRYRVVCKNWCAVFCSIVAENLLSNLQPTRFRIVKHGRFGTEPKCVQLNSYQFFVAQKHKNVIDVYTQDFKLNRSIALDLLLPYKFRVSDTYLVCATDMDFITFDIKTGLQLSQVDFKKIPGTSFAVDEESIYFLQSTADRTFLSIYSIKTTRFETYRLDPGSWRGWIGLANGDIFLKFDDEYSDNDSDRGDEANVYIIRYTRINGHLQETGSFRCGEEYLFMLQDYIVCISRTYPENELSLLSLEGKLLFHQKLEMSAASKWWISTWKNELCWFHDNKGVHCAKPN